MFFGVFAAGALFWGCGVRDHVSAHGAFPFDGLFAREDGSVLDPFQQGGVSIGMVSLDFGDLSEEGGRL